MHFVDYTHPGRVPALRLPVSRCSPEYYLRLDELPVDHSFYSQNWALFRHPAWLDGGSAWVHSKAIAADLQATAVALGVSPDLLRPVVGSADPGYDEALAQALRFHGYLPLVAEVVPRNWGQQAVSQQGVSS